MLLEKTLCWKNKIEYNIFLEKTHYLSEQVIDEKENQKNKPTNKSRTIPNTQKKQEI